MVFNDWLELIHHSRWDVRRVTQHKVQLPPPWFERFPPTAEMELTTTVSSEGDQIAFSKSKRVSTGVHGMALPVRENTGKRHGQSSRARSQVGPDPFHLGCILLQTLQSEVDEQLGFLTGDQGVGRHLQLKISPWTKPNQVLKGNVLIAMLGPKIRELVQRGTQLDLYVWANS
tara:strand:+ start:2772 stop:3290 length:519 start_codon:yes stop_codon:yes gene_type:complete